MRKIYRYTCRTCGYEWFQDPKIFREWCPECGESQVTATVAAVLEESSDEDACTCE